MRDDSKAGLKTLVAMLMILAGLTTGLLIGWQTRGTIGGQQPTVAQLVTSLKGFPAEHAVALHITQTVLTLTGIGALVGGIVGVAIIYANPGAVFTAASKTAESVRSGWNQSVTDHQNAKAARREAEEAERAAQVEAADPAFQDLRGRFARGEMTEQQFEAGRAALAKTRPAAITRASAQRRSSGGLAYFGTTLAVYFCLWLAFLILASTAGTFAVAAVLLLGAFGLIPAFFVAAVVGIIRALGQQRT